LKNGVTNTLKIKKIIPIISNGPRYLINDLMKIFIRTLSILFKSIRKGNKTAKINKGKIIEEKRIAKIEEVYPSMYVRIFRFREYL
jgi:hypothetical protein